MIKWYFIVGLILLNCYQFEYSQNQKNQHKNELLSLERNQQAKLLEIREQQHEDMIHAVNEALQRNQQTEAEYAALSDANKRLQHSIKQMDSRIKQLPESARAAYTSALTHVFTECTTAYSDLAKKADGHVSDIRMYQSIGTRKPQVKPKRKPLK